MVIDDGGEQKKLLNYHSLFCTPWLHYIDSEQLDCRQSLKRNGMRHGRGTHENTALVSPFFLLGHQQTDLLRSRQLNTRV